MDPAVGVQPVARRRALVTVVASAALAAGVAAYRLTYLLLLVAAVLGLLTAKDLRGRDLVNGLLAHGSVAWCAVVLMVAGAQLLRRSGRPLPY